MQRVNSGGPVTGPSIATALELVVASANNPVELNAVGTAVPDWRLVVQSVPGSDNATLYRLDASTDAVNPPYVVASFTPGLLWVAISGRFQNPTHTTANNLNAGDGTGNKQVTANGGNTNAADGAVVAVRNAGTPVVLLGNQSAINGGAYNPNPYMQVGPAGTSRLSVSGAVSIFHGDNAVSSTTGAEVIGDLVTPALNVGIGQGNIVAGGNVSVRSVPYTWPAASGVGQLTNDGAGLLTWAPSSGGSGAGINYCTNPNAEVNTAGWATYADAPGVMPVDGTGGAPTVTWIRNTVNPLRGVASFNLVKTAVNSQGQGASFDFTINLADTNKSLSMSFDTMIVSGTYAANDVTCWVYDVTNSRLIPVSSANGISGTGGFSAQFTTSASVSYRFIIHIGTVSALAYTLAFDNVALGPTYIPSMPAGTDWQDGGTITIQGVTTNPTKGTVVQDKVQWRRDGASGIFWYNYGQNAAGAAGSGDYLFSLPSGLAFDSTRVVFITGAVQPKDGMSLPAGLYPGISGSHYPGQTFAVPYDATRFRIFIETGSGSYAPFSAYFGSATSSLGSAGWGFSMQFEVPIAGWTNSQAVQPGTRYLWAQRYGNSATRVTVQPTQFGQYRARRLGVDTAPATAPTTADGIRVDGGSGLAAGRINQYDVFIGTGKVFDLVGYGAVGRTAPMNTEFTYNPSGEARGILRGYDPITGIVSFQAQTSNANDRAGYDPITTGTINPGYIDILIADDPVPLALGPSDLVYSAAIANWEDAGPITIGAVTTPPTKGTIVRDKVWFRRVGDTAQVRLEYQQSTAGTAGSGDYLYSLPGGLSFDAAKIEFDTTAYSAASPFARMERGFQGFLADGGTNQLELAIVPYDATRFRVVQWGLNGGSPGMNSSASFGLNTPALRFNVEFSAPILGWSATQAVQQGSRYLWSQRYASGAQRVTTTPTALGQYRSFVRTGGGTVFTDSAPTTPPSAANGILVKGGEPWGTSDPAGEPSKWQVYIGTGKIVAPQFYAAAARAGGARCDAVLAGTNSFGTLFTYDSTTGVAEIAKYINPNATALQQCAINGDATASFADVYADILIADDPVPVAIDATVRAFYARNSATDWIILGSGAGAAVLNRMHLVYGAVADYDITLPTNPAPGDTVGFFVVDQGNANKQYRLDAGAGVVICSRTRYLTLLAANAALLIWDGFRWDPLVLSLDTQWTKVNGITFTAVTTNPVKGTVTSDNYYWRRVGDMCEVQYNYLQAAAGTAGSGFYRVGLPFPYDTGRVERLADGTSYQNAQSQASLGIATLDTMGGLSSHGVGYGNTANNTTVSVSTVNETTGALYRWGSVDVGLNNANLGFGMHITYAALNW